MSVRLRSVCAVLASIALLAVVPATSTAPTVARSTQLADISPGTLGDTATSVVNECSDLKCDGDIGWKVG